MKKCKYKSGEKVYFLRTIYLDNKKIKVGNKEFCMGLKSFNYIDKGLIDNYIYDDNRKSYVYYIKNNYDITTAIIYENEIFINEKKALLACKKKNKYTYKYMLKELKELKKIIG
ncbi:MAG: hypothetical protein IJ880_05295 [Bacilli bacterium]|nr:hypothetical protein [Bacilli bacterium]